MEIAVIVIAGCMVLLTLFALATVAGLMVIGFRMATTLKMLERSIDDLRREVLPIIGSSRALAEDVRDVGRTVREQVHRSEKLIETSLQNVADTSVRVRDAVSGLSLVLGTLGKLIRMFKARS